MSTTAVCFARAFSKRMSDLFLLPCVVSPFPLPTPTPPAPRPTPGLRTHTAPFTLGLPPAPLPFSPLCSVFTCNLSLNVQCLSCSGVPRPSQWIGSSFGAEGRQTAWEMGPTCTAWWMAVSLRLHVSRLPGGGQGWPAPFPPPPASRCFVSCWGSGGEGKPSHPPAPRRAGPSGCGRGRAPPTTSRAKLLRSTAPPAHPMRTDAHTRSDVCPPDLVRSSGKRDRQRNRL
ncbi:formin-like protein 3 [Gallus gallus]|uniref:formin-like protein 3 n=1 Tax=Gallus gallus TaxID=9031 RepID=UPI001AE6A5E7|nr:formin-like protein 3 [Gallus gallus]